MSSSKHNYSSAVSPAAPDESHAAEREEMCLCFLLRGLDHMILFIRDVRLSFCIFRHVCLHLLSCVIISHGLLRDCLQADLAATVSEFESYKVRVHNVLKQQKHKSSAHSDGDAFKQERCAIRFTSTDDYHMFSFYTENLIHQCVTVQNHMTISFTPQHTV